MNRQELDTARLAEFATFDDDEWAGLIQYAREQN